VSRGFHSSQQHADARAQARNPSAARAWPGACAGCGCWRRRFERGGRTSSGSKRLQAMPQSCELRLADAAALSSPPATAAATAPLMISSPTVASRRSDGMAGTGAPRLAIAEVTQIVPLLWYWSFEQLDDAVRSTLQNVPLRARPRQDANTEQYAQQYFGQLGRWAGVGDRTVFLPGLDTAPEESLDEDHLLGDELLEFGVVGRQFECRVDEHAPAALSVGHRPFDDLVKERANRRNRRQLLQTGDSLADGLRQVVAERLAVERSLVAEGVVEAGTRDSHLLREIANRGLFVTLRPEAVHSRFQDAPQSRRCLDRLVI